MEDVDNADIFQLLMIFEDKKNVKKTESMLDAFM